jgi:hypothetical protein
MPSQVSTFVTNPTHDVEDSTLVHDVNEEHQEQVSAI